MALALVASTAGCMTARFVEPPVREPAQAGDPARGRELLVNRSYIRIGIPFAAAPAVRRSLRADAEPPPRIGGRRGINRFLPAAVAGRRVDGVDIVAETCLVCHAGSVAGQAVLGLGNAFIDSALPEDHEILDREKLASLKLSPNEQAMLSRWQDYVSGLLPHARSSAPGTTPALYFTGYLFSRRDAATFAWGAEAKYPMLATPPETDIPPWWHVRKKTSLYYGGEVTGDFTRSLMQFMSPPGNELADLQAAEADFKDILAYLRTIEPPKWPWKIDAALAERGGEVFNRTCSKCHGTYGAEEKYPGAVVPLAVVGTDPARNRFMHELGFAEHYNASWYGERSQMRATDGYVAPPLDGIWASAPYLHNGSVPTLEALLDPQARPQFFIRPSSSREYDREKVGWRVEVVGHGKAGERDPERRRIIVDTTQYGMSNAGHTFAAGLTGAERAALLEYLKTL